MIVGTVSININTSMDHVPNPVVARLEPLRPVLPLIERRRRARPTS
jgi:hypothetical protein